MTTKTLILLVLCLAWLGPAGAAESVTAGKTNAPDTATKSETKKEEAKPTVATIPDATHKPVLTTNTLTIAGQSVRYVTETGMLPLLKPDGSARASVFYVAYTRQDETGAATRPVTFSFNGGPGSSSVWLHLGALGPRRVKMNEDGTQPQPPFRLVDNDYSILPFTDLVFIDPVATGYSRPAKDEKTDQFFGQSPDVESVGDFIRLWTTRHERWLSPKYLCGESYGVFRAAGLAEHLHSRYGMYLNGLILVSGVLDFATLREGPGNDLPSLVFLPAYTATAQFHKKLPADLQADLPKDQGLILGRYDARITGRDADPAGRSPRFDPSYAATYGPFSAAMNAYVREELKFEDDLPYEILSGVQPWNYDARGSYPSVADRLASAMSQNPYLRVLVLGGLRDLACPMDGIRYSIDHLQLDPAFRKNITYAEYQSGHMMYVNLTDLKQMQKDLKNFIVP
jgi:carboxypeptidase C (cathepsin A)